MKRFKAHSLVKRILAMALAVVMAVPAAPFTSVAASVSEGDLLTTTAEATQPVYTIKADVLDALTTQMFEGVAVFNLDAIKEGISLYEDGELYGTLAEAGFEGKEILNNITLSYKQETEEGIFVDMEADAYPVNAGNYKLVITLPETEDYAGATEEILLTIEKYPIDINVQNDAAEAEYPAGAKVGDILSAGVFTDVTAMIGNEEYSYGAGQIAVVNEICDLYTDEVLSDEAILYSNGTYYIHTQASWEETVPEYFRMNFELVPAKTPVSVYRTETTMNATLTGEWGDVSAYCKIYDGTPMETPVLGEDYTAEVSVNDVKLENVEITGHWYNDYQDLLDGAPTEPGEYFYVLSYAGEEGLYSGCENALRAFIFPRKAEIRPQLKEDVTIYSGMTVKEVLAKIADYTLWDVTEETAVPVEADKEFFWGMPDLLNYERYFAPEFGIYQVGVKGSDEVLTPAQPLGRDDTLSSEYVYEIRSTGYVVSYSINDGEDSPLRAPINDVFGQNKHYYVDTGSETLAKNAVTLPVSDVQIATIDVSAILKDGAGAALDNPITKVYDALPIYSQRSDFKKAVVTLADGSVRAKNADKQLDYCWEYSENGTEWSKVTPYKGSPSDAGYYRIRISFRDAEDKYAAETKEVYYLIEKQKVKIVPKSAPEAWTQTDVVEYDMAGIEYEIWTVPDEGEPVKLNWNENGYTIYWDIEKTASPAGEESVYVSAAGEVFAEGYDYRLVVDELELNFLSYDNNYVNYITDSENPDERVYLNDVTLPIKVNVMGSDEIFFEIDSEKVPASKEYDGKAIEVPSDLIVVKDSEGKAVNGLVVEYTWYSEADQGIVDSPMNVGTYTLYASFAGDKEYKAYEEVITVLQISKRKVNVTFEQMAPIYGDDALDNSELGQYFFLEFEGFLPDDAKYFERQINRYGDELYYYYSYLEIDSDIYNDEGMIMGYAPWLSCFEKYTIKPKPYFISGSYCSQVYELICDDEIKITAERKPSTVVSVEEGEIPSVLLSDSVEGLEHTITFMDAVPFVNFENEKENGNYVAFNIIAPDYWHFYDYNDLTVITDIEKVGGTIITHEDGESNTLTVVFPAEEAVDKEFYIYWVEGCVEHFVLKFSEAELLPNLKEAVSPKALSFIAPPKKLEVGREKQLDVKVTKQQVGDIICLGYTSSNPEILTVDENGHVYARKPGKASVTVYAATVVNGKMTEIPGGKKATVSITVTDLSAVKINEFEVGDTAIYTGWVASGYPSSNESYDIYVLEGKNKKVSDFEKAIESMEGLYWEDTFAVKPMLSLRNWHCYIRELQPNTDYTLCVVRNRVLANQSGIETQYEAMTVKSFKTTKLQMNDLFISLDSEQVKWDAKNEEYVIPLSLGSVNLSAEGVFYDYEEDLSDYELVSYKLPLSKELQKKYATPKLMYDVWGGDTSEKIATIDKKGKLTLKGVGQIEIFVYDSFSGENAYLYARIEGSASAVSNKQTKLQVGQTIALEDLLTYSVGKKNLTGSYDKSVIVDDALIAAFKGNSYFKLDVQNKTVTAVKAGGKLVVSLTDEYIKNAGGTASANATLQSTALKAVSNVKTKNVTDKHFDVQFDYSGYADEFRIEVKDARGKLVRRATVQESYLYDDLYDVYSYRVTGLTQRSKYTYTVVALYDEETSSIVKKTVTTTKMPASYVSLMDDETEIESIANALSINSWEEYEQYCWANGVDVRIVSQNYRKLSNGSESYNYVCAGNSYTLELFGDKLNYGAVAAGNDTLIWTSSDPKVATIKANAGTEAATLTTLKSGYTKIEVKSKITGAVISRFWIDVYAIGNGYDYYSDNEQLPERLPEESKEIQKLILDTPKHVIVDSGEFVWLSFTAPYDGHYEFYSEAYSDSDPEIWVFDQYYPDLENADDFDAYCIAGSDDGFPEGYDFCTGRYMDQDETIYFIVSDCNANEWAEFDVIATYPIG